MKESVGVVQGDWQPLTADLNPRNYHQVTSVWANPNFQPHPTEAQGRILEGAMNTWTMGTLTLIGLLGIGGTNPKA